MQVFELKAALVSQALTRQLSPWDFELSDDH